MLTIDMPKVDVVPPMLPVRAMTVAGVGGFWNIVRVKSRCEKALTMDLLENGFDFFLPLLKGSDRYNRVTYSPLEALKGFVFVSSPEQPPEGYNVPESLGDFLHHHPYFYGHIPTTRAGQTRLVRELEMIYAGVVAGTIRAGEFAVKGRRCRVKSGPFMGQAAIIEAVTKKGMVIIPITILGREVLSEIDVKHLEPDDQN